MNSPLPPAPWKASTTGSARVAPTFGTCTNALRTRPPCLRVIVNSPVACAAHGGGDAGAGGEATFRAPVANVISATSAAMRRMRRTVRAIVGTASA